MHEQHEIVGQTRIDGIKVGDETVQESSGRLLVQPL